MGDHESGYRNDSDDTNHHRDHDRFGVLDRFFHACFPFSLYSVDDSKALYPRI